MSMNWLVLHVWLAAAAVMYGERSIALVLMALTALVCIAESVRDYYRRKLARLDHAQSIDPRDDALAAAKLALDDWLSTYAAEFCDEQRVREANKRIFDAGGTLAYVADVVLKINRAQRKGR